MNLHAGEGVPIIYNGWRDSSEQDKEVSKKTTAPRKGGVAETPGSQPKRLSDFPYASLLDATA